MNEKAIKELYWELHARAKSLNEKMNAIGGTEKAALTKKIQELSRMLTELTTKAKDKGIDIKDKAGLDIEENAANDWEQLLTISSLPEEVKGQLKTRITGLGTLPTATQMNELLQFCDKYYNQNIAKLKKERAIKSFEKNKETYTNQDVSRIVADYQKAAKATLAESIGKLDSSFKLQMAEVQPIFDSYHSGEKVMEGDTNNDWKTQIEESDLLDEIKQALEQQISTLSPAPTPKQMRDLLASINKYYQANVGALKEENAIASFEKNMKRSFSNEDLTQIMNKHKKSGINALLEGIKNINTTFLIDMNGVHGHFENFYLGNNPLSSVVEGISNIPHQFKIDLKTKKLEDEKKIGPLVYKDPTIQLSMKGGYVKAAHLARTLHEEVCTSFVDSYEQYLRSTITLGSIGDMMKGKFHPKMSSNAFSSGIQIDLAGGIGNIVVKCDWINMTWADIEFDKDGVALNKLLEPSLGAFRIQGNIDLVKASQYFNIDMPGIELQRGIATLAVGCNICLSKDYYADFVTKKAKQYLADRAEKAAQKKILEAVKKGAEELAEHADDVKDIVDDVIGKNRISEARKNIAKKIAEKANQLKNNLGKLKGVFKEAGEKAIKAAGEKLMSKAKVELMKKAALIAGKTVLKFVPVVGQIVTAIEVGVFIWQLASWWYSNQPAASSGGSNNNSGFKSGSNYNF
jgi:hypothetical protein